MYLLMKKEKPVLSFVYYKNDTIKIQELFEEELLPFSLLGDKLTSINFKKWLLKRAISDSRDSTQKLIALSGCSSKLSLILKSYGLNLTDVYWVKEESDNHTWAELNFFQNGYSKDIGNFLIKNEDTDFCLSPDINTNGVMEKAWRKKKEGDFLFKLGKPPFYQEPINEVICYQIAKTFPNLKAVPYYLSDINGKKCSFCKNLLTENIELVPASYLYNQEDDVYGNPYYYLVQKGKELGMTNIKEFFDDMILFDFAINNEDRHLGNICFLRDADTGIFIGPAPLFDNGSSLWAGEIPAQMALPGSICKPFANTHEAQLKYVRSYENMNVPELKNMADCIFETIKEHYDEERADAIVKQYSEKVEHLNQLQQKHIHKYSPFQHKDFNPDIELR